MAVTCQQLGHRPLRLFYGLTCTRCGTKMDPNTATPVTLAEIKTAIERLLQVAILREIILRRENPESGICEKYSCVYESKAHHEEICPGNVSFRPSRATVATKSIRRDRL